MVPERHTVELTTDGYLRLDAETARTFFPEDTLVPLRKGRELWLLPTRGPAAGGLLLKQRNRQGDRSVLVSEALVGEALVGEALGATPVGMLLAFWDEAQGALRVGLPEEVSHDARLGVSGTGAGYQRGNTT